MHGLGNDFMVLDGINQRIELSAQQIAALGNRYTGVGFDQCLIIESSQDPAIDFNYRIFNANGQEVGQCGNGARCLALFAKRYGLTQKDSINVATKTTQMRLDIHPNEQVSVHMNVPKRHPQDIPLLANNEQQTYLLHIAHDKLISIHAINVGNPHAVLIVPDISTAPIHDLGQQISEHPYFPEQTNVGFMQLIDKQHIKLRVYERGCGETQACGSGAVAAAAIGRLYYGLEEHIYVTLPGGELLVHWQDKDSTIILTGPAIFVYEGILSLQQKECAL